MRFGLHADYQKKMYIRNAILTPRESVSFPRSDDEELKELFDHIVDPIVASHYNDVVNAVHYSGFNDSK